MLKRILGRQTDVIRTKNGGYLTVPTFFGASAIQSIHGLLRYQIVQNSIDHFTMNLKIDDRFRLKDEALLKKLFHDFVGCDSMLQFNYSDNFENNKNGKTNLVISHI
jgi:hypothetical protein